MTVCTYEKPKSSRLAGNWLIAKLNRERRLAFVCHHDESHKGAMERGIYTPSPTHSSDRMRWRKFIQARLLFDDCQCADHTELGMVGVRADELIITDLLRG